MKNHKFNSFLLPMVLILLLIILSYNNVVFFRRSLNPVLLIPPWDIQLSTGYGDISGSTSEKHGWHVDLANPAYLEWPVNAFIGKSLKAGHIPMVMPYQSLGVPLIGQYCHRVLSPYQMIENLFFPHGYDFFLLLRLFLAGIFAYLFIRPLCRRVESALVTAIGYGLGSIMVIYSNHEEVANVAMMLPLLMWAIRAFFDHPSLSRACWLTLALSMVHTAGQPEIQLYLLLLALLYGLTRIFAIPIGIRRTAFAYSLAAICLSAVIAAPQIILFLQFHHEAWTFHPPGGSLGIQSPMTIHRFLFSFFPRLRQTSWPWSYRTINLLWDWIGGYFSFGLLFLAVSAVRKPRRNRREISIFGLYFLFILAKNLGWSPAQLLGTIPLFDQTWSPRWSAATWSFALAVLAGFGLDNLLDQSPLTTSDNSKEAVLKSCSLSAEIQPQATLAPAVNFSTGLPATDAGQMPPRSNWKNTVQSKFTAFQNSPLAISTLLFIVIILIIIFWWQGSLNWSTNQMRGYIIFNGFLFFLLAVGAILLYLLLSRPVRNYLISTGGAVKDALIHNQIGMISLLAASSFAALRWFPVKHYLFSQPEPFASYLFAAPLLLLSISGLFYLASNPSNPVVVLISAIAIPTALIGGWAELPGGFFQTIFWVLFALTICSFFIFSRKSRRVRFVFSALSFPLLAGLVTLVMTATFFSDEADRMLRLHYYFAIILLAVLSGLSYWRSRGGTGCGWFFLFLVWSELTIYIPKNHLDRFLIIDYIPLLAAILVVLGFALWFRRAPLSGKKIAIFLFTGILISGGSLFILEKNSSDHLPATCTPKKPLPYISFLREKGPSALFGIGRILAPNFASAHDLTDLRGCNSMNTSAFQFFQENLLRVVYRNSSYSLWYTGDNPLNVRKGSPYGSSRDDHVNAFKRAVPFFSLTSARYVLSPKGLLDNVGTLKSRGIKKVYSEEIDIWEIPSLPPAYIAHKEEVISMISDTRRWGTTVVTDKEVLGGNRVILEENPPRQMLESESNPTDRAELIMGDNPNRMKVKFFSEKPAYLVISRAYTNLLRAYLDGDELPILKANGPFMAVPVPGSQKERVLELTYISTTTKISFAMSILAILAVVAGIIFGRKRQQERKGR